MLTSGESGFTAALEPGAGFGGGLCRLGDVNGDGHDDLGVLDFKFIPEHARFWVLFLGADGEVLDHTVTSGAELDIGWTSPAGDARASNLGWDADAVGDLDDDGIAEVALSLRDFGGHCGFSVVSLAADGSVRKRLDVAEGTSGLPEGGERGTWFAMAVSGLGDLGGDGTPEVALGSPADRSTQAGIGSVSIVSLDADPIRVGSGVNPIVLDELAEPVLGRTRRAPPRPGPDAVQLPRPERRRAAQPRDPRPGDVRRHAGAAALERARRSRRALTGSRSSSTPARDAAPGVEGRLYSCFFPKFEPVVKLHTTPAVVPCALTSSMRQ